MPCETCINEDRIKKLEEDSFKCQISVALTDERYSNIITMMADMKKDIAEIKGKPARRWETVITGIITGIVGILIGLISTGVLGR